MSSFSQPGFVFANSFFASYNRADAGWMYSMGNFASMSLPLTDSATLTIQRVNSTRVETITVRDTFYMLNLFPDDERAN